MRRLALGEQAENRQVAYLSSPDVRSSIQRVLEHQGLTLLHDAELVDLQHRPGAGATGVFRVRTAPGPGQSSPPELYVALTAESVPEDAVIDAGCASDTDWSAWFHPHDPRLNGLALASDPESVAAVWGAGEPLSELQTVSYRPLRRAVLRAVFGGRTVFLKVMRGGLATGLHHRHVLLAAAGVPVPPVLGPPVADVLALGEGTGTVLAGEIMADGAKRIDPAEVTELLDRMPAELLSLPRREAWSDRTPSYGHAAATALPDQARRIRSLVDHLQRQLDASDRGPVVPTHGDLYEANLLVADGRISCVLDIDGAGPGHRVDDLACFLGHLAVLPTVDERYVFTDSALRRFHSHFVTTVDPAALACRSASVALSLVAGARDSGRRDWQSAARRRLDVAESLLGLPQSASGW
jgi:hypothetical protein